MDILLIINSAIFAMLFPLFALEGGAAGLYLVAYDKYKEALTRYIAISWEISGTFLVFYLVNFEATFPTLLPIFGTVYLTPVLLAAAFVLFRNAFIVYSEYASTTSIRRIEAHVYALATILAGFFFLAIISSTVTGAGVNLLSRTSDIIAMISNPYSIAVFLGMGSLSMIAAIVFFRIRATAPLLGLVVLSAVMFLYALPSVPNLFNSAVNTYWYMDALLAILFISMILLHIRRSGAARILVFPWLMASSIAFQLYEYPLLFGGAIDMTNYLPPSASAYYVVLVTIIGAIILGIALSVLLYAERLSRSKRRKKGNVY